jgi:hypothetical protein
MKKIDSCVKDVQKKYSSRLVKKIKSLIFNTEVESASDLSTLTDNLVELDEEFARVMAKVKKV